MRIDLLCCCALAVIAGERAGAQTALSPGGRTGAYMVYDAARGQTLLFGGWTRLASGGAVTYPADLWAWDGNVWRKLEPPAGTPRPVGRDVPVVAYDAARERVVMFGGRGDGTGQPAGWLTDVWEWDGTRWHHVPTNDMPRILHPVAGYDPARRRVAVYGGALLGATGTFSSFSRTLWEWDGAHWTARDTAGPIDQFPSVMAARRNGEIMVFGGQVGGVNRDSPRVPSQVWAFKAPAWTRREDAPAFNNLQALAAGPDGTLYLYQSWEEWLTAPLMHVRDANGAWHHPESTTNPGIRNTAAAAWDARRNRFVIYGGLTRDQRLLDDTWEFDGRSWTKR